MQRRAEHLPSLLKSSAHPLEKECFVNIGGCVCIEADDGGVDGGFGIKAICGDGKRAVKRRVKLGEEGQGAVFFAAAH